MGGDRREPGLRGALRFYGATAFRVAGSLALGFLAGYALDMKLGTHPWFAIIGFFLGIGAGVWHVYEMVVSDLTRGKPGPKRRRHR